MTAPIRLRRHSDGRVALKMPRDPQWWVFRATRSVLGPFKCRKANDEVAGEGWSEMVVAELPEPDGQVDCAVAACERYRAEKVNGS